MAEGSRAADESPPASRGEADTRTMVGAPPRAPGELTIPAGTRIGRYVVLGRLGEGGAGLVCAAYDPELDRKVAIKLLHPKDEGDLERLRRRLQREAQAMARVSHPNVVAVHDVGTFAGQVFLAMDHVEGGTLRAWLLARPERSRSEVLAVVVAAGRGLEAAHGAGLVHRDFKPDNVLVRRDGHAFVTDFGLVHRGAGTPSDDGAPLPPDAPLPLPLVTRVDTIMGTPGYMAPEQYAGSAVDARTDQFSFCVTAFEALAGERLFRGETMAEVEARTRAGADDVLARSHLPRHVVRALARGLAVDMDRRWPSMHELLAALTDDPRARWRSRLLVATTATLAAVSLGLGAAVAARGRTTCSGGEDRWAAAVPEGTLAAGRRAIAGSGIAGAEQVATYIEGALRAYGRGWVETERRVCEASPGGSDPLVVMERACLAQKLATASSVAALLAATDRESATHALEAVASLPAVRACEDTAGLGAPVAPPAPGETAQKVEALRRRLAAVEADELASRFRPGRDEVVRLLSEARSIAYEPLVAELLHRRADLEVALGEHAAAELTFEEAARVADHAHHEAARARALVGLAFVRGYWLGDLKTGAATLADAEALVSRLGQSDIEGDFLEEGALIHIEAGRLDEALALSRRLLALRERTDGTDHVRTATAHDRLGVCLQLHGDLEGAEREHRLAFTLMARVFGTEHLRLTTIYDHLGTLYAHGKRFDEAEEAYDHSLRLITAELGEQHPRRAMALQNIGYMRYEAGHLREAQEALTTSLRIYEANYGTDYYGTVEARAALVEVELGLRQYDRAFEDLDRIARVLATTKEAGAHARANLDFLRGRAAYESGRDRDGGRRLVEASLAEWEALTPPRTDSVAGVRAWLSAHPRSRPSGGLAQ